MFMGEHFGDTVTMWEFLRTLPESAATDYITAALARCGTPVPWEIVHAWLTRPIDR